LHTLINKFFFFLENYYRKKTALQKRKFL